MSEFVEVSVSELTGAALNWATFCAVYTGLQPNIRVTESETRLLFKGAAKPVTFPRTVRLTYFGAYGFEHSWFPSSDWVCGGPLIEKHRVGIYCDYTEQETITANVTGSGATSTGPTYLIAACRAIVSSVLGETVSVPKELV